MSYPLVNAGQPRLAPVRPAPVSARMARMARLRAPVVQPDAWVPQAPLRRRHSCSDLELLARPAGVIPPLPPLPAAVVPPPGVKPPHIPLEARGKLRLYAQCLADPAYARGLAWLNVAQVGDGMALAGSMMMLGALGLVSPTAGIQWAVSMVGLGESCAAATGAVIAASQRDNARKAIKKLLQAPQQPAALHAYRVTQARRISWTAVADLAGAAALLGAGVAAVTLGCSVLPVWLALTGVKIAQVISRGFRVTTWDTLKYVLNPTGTLARHAGFNSTIAAIESATGLVALSLGSLAIFAAAALVGPAVLPALAFGAILGGSLLSGAAKLAFIHEARRRPA